MRQVALNLARAEKSKGALRGKLKKAEWHEPFMLNLFRATFHVQKRLPGVLTVSQEVINETDRMAPGDLTDEV